MKGITSTTSSPLSTVQSSGVDGSRSTDKTGKLGDHTVNLGRFGVPSLKGTTFRELFAEFRQNYKEGSKQLGYSLQFASSDPQKRLRAYGHLESAQRSAVSMDVDLSKLHAKTVTNLVRANIHALPHPRSGEQIEKAVSRAVMLAEVIRQAKEDGLEGQDFDDLMKIAAEVGRPGSIQLGTATPEEALPMLQELMKGLRDGTSTEPIPSVLNFARDLFAKRYEDASSKELCGQIDSYIGEQAQNVTATNKSSFIRDSSTEVTAVFKAGIGDYLDDLVEDARDIVPTDEPALWQQSGIDKLKDENGKPLSDIAKSEIARRGFETFEEMMEMIIGGTDPTSIKNAADKLPQSFCDMLATAHKSIDDNADDQFKADLHKVVDANFLMLRLVNPALTSAFSKPDPQTGKVDTTARDNLVAVTKLIQNVVNGVHVGGKEVPPPSLGVQTVNDSIDKWASAFDAFAKAVLARGVPGGSPTPTVGTIVLPTTGTSVSSQSDVSSISIDSDVI